MRAGQTGQGGHQGYSAAGDVLLHGLFGREREFGALSDLVDQARGGTGGALVVRGEAGTGKSALLDAVSAEAAGRGMQVLSAVGVQSEANLAFAGLHQMVRPALHLA